MIGTSFFLDFESFLRIFEILFKRDDSKFSNSWRILRNFEMIVSFKKFFFRKFWRYFGEALQNFIRLKSLLLIHFYFLLLPLSLFLFCHHLQRFLLCFSAFRLPKWKSKSQSIHAKIATSKERRIQCKFQTRQRAKGSF